MMDGFWDQQRQNAELLIELGETNVSIGEAVRLKRCLSTATVLEEYLVLFQLVGFSAEAQRLTSSIEELASAGLSHQELLGVPGETGRNLFPEYTGERLLAFCEWFRRSNGPGSRDYSVVDVFREMLQESSIAMSIPGVSVIGRYLLHLVVAGRWDELGQVRYVDQTRAATGSWNRVVETLLSPGFRNEPVAARKALLNLLTELRRCFGLGFLYPSDMSASDIVSLMRAIAACLEVERDAGVIIASWRDPGLLN